MSSPEPTRAEREASEWLVLLESAVVPAAELERFRTWLAASPDHRIAYAAIAERWDKAGPALASAPRELLLGSAEPSRSSQRSARMRPLIVGVAIAAGAALFMLAPLPDISLFGPEAAYATAARQSRIVRLADRSSVELSPLTSLSVDYSDTTRLILLSQGVGYFNVADDPRPFVVRTPNGEVRGRGLGFIVRVEAGHTIVSVLDGALSASAKPGASLFARLLQHRHTEALHSGDEVRLQAGAADMRRLTPAQERARLAWRDGRVVLDDAELGDAALEVTRFSGVRFRFDDAQLAHLHVSGSFAGDDVAGFLAALRANFAIQARRAGEFITLSRPSMR